MTDTDQFPSLDQLDVQLIAELEAEPRQSYKAIAAKLGVKGSTVTSRTQRLIDGSVIKPMCLVDTLAVGYKFVVFQTIHVQTGWASEIANKLAAFDRVLSVQLCTGLSDIIVCTFFRTGDELSDFLSNLKPLPGLLHTEMTMLLEAVKRNATPSIADRETLRIERQKKNPVKLDSLDLKLIRELQKDARQNSVQLGRKLGVYQSTAFRRMQRLLDEHIIQFALYFNPAARGYEGKAAIGMKCYPGKVNRVADTIASYEQVQYVCICTGRYDVFAFLVFKTQDDLRHFITVELGNVPGLKEAETMFIYKHVKIPQILV